MSGVIKSRDVGVPSKQRRALFVGSGDGASQDSPRRADEIANLQQRIVLLEAEFAEAAQTASRRESDAFSQGLTEGERLGRLAIQEDGAQRLALLRRSLEEAQSSFALALESMERLSLNLATGALNKVLGRADGYVDLLSRSVAHHVKMLVAETVISASVSEEDFPDGSALASLQDHLPADLRRKVLAFPEMPRGACVIRLESGEVDAGLDTQLITLAKILDELRG